MVTSTCDDWLDVAEGAEICRPAYAAEREQRQALLCLAAALTLRLKSPRVILHIHGDVVPFAQLPGAHLQGFEQLLDRGDDLLLPGAAADHCKALCDRLLCALAGILLTAWAMQSQTLFGAASEGVQPSLRMSAVLCYKTCRKRLRHIRSGGLCLRRPETPAAEGIKRH